ncbi:hypothetical protein E2C01_008897 [Portunus trituberculatus]|uniref:Uncharacterized protein n=1 Tax=Portunus trituberculatus TaxID=210409 RepID=A0A5B7D4X4_PORTR|nr:hypothetical protein [Portunus trituberculatus]
MEVARQGSKHGKGFLTSEPQRTQSSASGGHKGTSAVTLEWPSGPDRADWHGWVGWALGHLGSYIGGYAMSPDPPWRPRDLARSQAGEMNRALSSADDPRCSIFPRRTTTRPRTPR